MRTYAKWDLKRSRAENSLGGWIGCVAKVEGRIAVGEGARLMADRSVSDTARGDSASRATRISHA
jgi:hypothetical protein